MIFSSVSGSEKLQLWMAEKNGAGHRETSSLHVEADCLVIGINVVEFLED